MTDELRTGKQAREDTAMALIEAGLTKGMSHLQLDSLEDIEHLYAEVRKMGPKAIYVFRIPREVAERGQISGATAAILISGLPENVLGGVMLSFDGWADDPRELFQIPCVVDFCYGFIKGNIPDLATGKKALAYLVDESDLVKKIGAQGWDAAGRLWTCGTAFPQSVYVRSPQSPSGWKRDIGKAGDILDWIEGTGPKPSFI